MYLSSLTSLRQQFLKYIKNIEFDYILAIGITSIFIFGLGILFSAKGEWILLKKQISHFILASIVMLFIAQISTRHFMRWALILYIFGVICLILVLFFGEISKGAQRWLSLGVIRFQPAEIMKVAMPLMLARYFDYKHLPANFQTLIPALLLILLPATLIIKQPDLGTAIIVTTSGILVIFFAGISWQSILGALISFLVSLPILWIFLYNYQKQRILTLLNPERDPLGSGYHIIQSKIAIGSGGFLGKGWLHGSQSQLEFLPERSTDFIFAVLGEEFGTLGCMFLLLLYAIVLFRSLYIALSIQHTFSRLLVASLSMTTFISIFVNISMVNGLLPVVGIPLPLFSYGGTALMTNMLNFGIISSIWKHRIVKIREF